MKKSRMKTPLARVLESQGMSQRALIKALGGGMDATQMSNYVHGKLYPGRRNAERIANALPGLIDEMQLLYPKRYPDPNVMPTVRKVKVKA